MTKYEYIWLDGYEPEANLRSKVKVTDGEPPVYPLMVLLHFKQVEVRLSIITCATIRKSY